MPIYDPLRDRSTGLPQSWDDRFRQPNNVPRGTSHNLIPCYHVKMHCPKDGYYNLRVKDQPTYLATSCSHCKRPAQVISTAKVTPPQTAPYSQKASRLFQLKATTLRLAG